MSIDQNCGGEKKQADCRERQLLHLLPQIGQKMKNSILNTYLKPLNLVFLGHLPMFSAEVRRIKRRGPLQSGEIQTAEIHPKGSRILWLHVIQCVRKIQFTNGVTWGLYHGPIKPTCFRGFYANNLVFRWPKPYFSMGFGGLMV